MTGELWGLMGNWFSCSYSCCVLGCGETHLSTLTQKVQSSLYLWASHVLKGEYRRDRRSGVWNHRWIQTERVSLQGLAAHIYRCQRASVLMFGIPPQTSINEATCQRRENREVIQTWARVWKLDLHIPLSRNTFLTAQISSEGEKWLINDRMHEDTVPRPLMQLKHRPNPEHKSTIHSSHVLRRVGRFYKTQ